MKKLLFLIILSIAAVVTLAVFNRDIVGSGTAQVSNTAELSMEEQSRPLTQEYTHPKYEFYFKYPEGYTITTTEMETGEMLIMQNNKGQGFQMSVTPIEEDVNEITIDMVKRDLPELGIKEPQDVLIGANGKGVAFISDDPLFNGNSREIWFAHNKVFYQITTYAEYDTLLKNIFATWQFK